VTNTWLATSPVAGLVTGRYGHGAIWTGSELVVSDGMPAAPTGGAYCAVSCTAGPPGLVTGFIASSNTSFAWDDLPGPHITYDFVSGAVPYWPVGGVMRGHCLAINDPEPGGVDTLRPDADSGFWYLVRARDACGQIGSYGSASDGTPRQHPLCP